MGVFDIFKIVLMVKNREKHHKWLDPFKFNTNNFLRFTVKQYQC